MIFSCVDAPYQTWGDFYPATASALAYALHKTDVKLVFADFGNHSTDSLAIVKETVRWYKSREAKPGGSAIKDKISSVQ